MSNGHHGKRLLGVVASLFLSELFLLNAEATAQAACTHYASPDGAGTGSSPSSPFQVADFWPVAGPGKTLCLLNGTYTGDDSMITPPAGLSGTNGNPITISALHDGKVLIDGENTRPPVKLAGSSWWVLEGFNAAHGGEEDVVELFPISPGDNTTGSNYNVIRRVVGWDAKDVNSSIFLLWSSHDNLLEDCAGFGTARKIFQPFARADNNIFRRIWSQWTYSTASASGPHGNVTVYDSANVIYENAVSTWDEDQGADTTSAYALFSINQYDRFTEDGIAASHDTNSKFIGSIAYSLSSQSGDFMGALQGGQAATGIYFQDVATFIGAGHTTNSEALSNLCNVLTSDGGCGLYGGPAAPGKHALTNITAIRVDGPSTSIDSDWTITNRQTGTSAEAVYGADSLYRNDGTKGATICYQTIHGDLTNIPLFPWPMNQRIKDAMASANRTPRDVEADIESIFGPVPAACRSDGSSGSGGMGGDGGTSGDGGSSSGSGVPGVGGGVSDGGAGPSGDNGGCGCVVAGAAGRAQNGALIGLLAGLLMWRRRRPASIRRS